MESVKIYKVWCWQAYQMCEQGGGCQFRPWVDSKDYKGYDDGGLDYLLPNGYHLDTDRFDEPMIVGPHDVGCALFLEDGQPTVLEFTDGTEPVTLALA